MRLILILILISFSSKSFASIKDNLIKKMSKIENFSFTFEQNINEKKETGKCTISFNKKIFCKYYLNNKILVSNGKKLFIKNSDTNFSSIYDINKTYFVYILNKEYILLKLKNHKKNFEKKGGKIFVRLNEDDFQITLFFNSKNYLLNGWFTKDLYGNDIRTYIEIQKINYEFSDDIFKITNYN